MLFPTVPLFPLFMLLLKHILWSLETRFLAPLNTYVAYLWTSAITNSLSTTNKWYYLMYSPIWILNLFGMKFSGGWHMPRFLSKSRVGLLFVTFLPNILVLAEEQKEKSEKWFWKIGSSISICQKMGSCSQNIGQLVFIGRDVRKKMNGNSAGKCSDGCLFTWVHQLF